MTIAPFYYPGAANVADATPLTIGPAEEKDNVDFVLKLVPTARVSGSILAPDGQAPFGSIVTLQSKTDATASDVLSVLNQASVDIRVGRDGTFFAPAVPPGDYTIVARAQDRSVTSPQNGRAMAVDAGRGGSRVLWATEDISVAGQDVSGLTLALQPGMTISGRLVPDASVTTSFDQWIVRAVPAGDLRMGGPAASPDSSGIFSLSGIAPGRYRLTVVSTGPGRAGRAGRGAAVVTPAAAAVVPSAPAVVASVTIHGQDALDLPFDLRPGENIPDVAVRLTSHLGEISGALGIGAGQPATGYVIVVFAADRAYWATDNRRMPQPAATDRDGAYRVTNLPAGELLVAAATDLDPDSLHDADVLAALAKQAIHVTLAEGETKTQNFTIGGGA